MSVWTQFVAQYSVQDCGGHCTVYLKCIMGVWGCLDTHKVVTSPPVKANIHWYFQNGGSKMPTNKRKWQNRKFEANVQFECEELRL